MVVLGIEFPLGIEILGWATDTEMLDAANKHESLGDFLPRLPSIMFIPGAHTWLMLVLIWKLQIKTKEVMQSKVKDCKRITQINE
jgi:hypothetical protein